MSDEDQELSIDWSGLGDDEQENGKPRKEPHEEDASPEPDESQDPPLQLADPSRERDTDKETSEQPSQDSDARPDFGDESLELVDVDDDSGEPGGAGDSGYSGGSSSGEADPVDGEHGDPAESLREGGRRPQVSEPTTGEALSRGVQLFAISLSDLIVWSIAGGAVFALLGVIAVIGIPELKEALLAGASGQPKEVYRIIAGLMKESMILSAALGYLAVVIFGGWAGSYLGLLRSRFFGGSEVEDSEVFSAAFSALPAAAGFQSIAMPVMFIGFMMCYVPGLIISILLGPALYIAVAEKSGVFHSLKKAWGWLKNYWLQILLIQGALTVASYGVMFSGQFAATQFGGSGLMIGAFVLVTGLAHLVSVAIWTGLYASIEGYENEQPPAQAVAE